MTETQFLLGKLIEGNPERDAVHVAVIPVIAGEDYMRPGSHVGFVYGSTTVVKTKEPIYELKAIGVIDPFLKDYASKGDRVWLFLYPNTVTGMRHHWTHPALTPQAPKDDSEKWLREFADRWNFDYDEMIGNASDPEGYVVARGIDLHSRSELGDDEALFWQHISNVTGTEYDASHRESFGWSCSC